MVNDLRAVLSWIDGRLRFRWALLVPVLGVAAVLEAVAAIAVFGLLRLVVEPHRVRITPIASQVWQAWPTDNPTAVLAAITTGVALFYVLRGLYVSLGRMGQGIDDCGVDHDEPRTDCSRASSPPSIRSI